MLELKNHVADTKNAYDRLIHGLDMAEDCLSEMMYQ